MRSTASAPPDGVHDLTLPVSGSTTARDLLARCVRQTFARFSALPLRAFAPDTAAALDEARRVLGAVLRAQPGVALSLARRPTISAFINCLYGRVVRDGESAPPGTPLEGWAHQLTSALHFELALSRALPGPVSPPYAISQLASLAFNQRVTFEGETRLTFESGALSWTRGGASSRVTLPETPGADVSSASGAGAAWSHPYLPLRGGFAFAEHDDNPLAMVEAHPEKHGNAMSLGEHARSEWRSTLEAAYALCERYLPDLAREMSLVLHQIVPVGFDAHRHFSASYTESIGTVYLSLHPNLLTMTEALIHEFQHNKLAMLFHLDPVLENAFTPLFKSPVRPDPRPLWGVLLAVHAFLPVARLYEGMFRAGDPLVAEPPVVRRVAQVKKLNRDGCRELLANARPTPVGASLLREIAQWHDYFESGRDGLPAYEGDLGAARDVAEH